MRFMRSLFAGILSLLAANAYGAGTLNIALQQQFSFTNCATNTNACGTPLIGGQLFFYQVGTVATQQNSFQDTALTIQNPWPLTLDANGRVPNFYLADGSVHVRLTDSGGVVQFDLPSALVIGPSGGGGGGGGSVDPTTIAGTGDVKFRPTSEFVTGWVKLNGTTIGSAVSGATQRANADTQALYIYLWLNCVQAHCPVTGGRGASGLADFNANKPLAVLDMRGRSFFGLDDMGTTSAGRILASNVTSGGGDTVTTPAASGGEANHVLTVPELAAHSHANTLTDPGHTHAISPSPLAVGGPNAGPFSNGATNTPVSQTQSATTGITINNATTGSGAAHNTMAPFMLGTWLQKL